MLLSYILGYIIRLTTPDFLDQISAQTIVKNWGRTEKKKRNRFRDVVITSSKTPEADYWPFHGDPESKNKYPYYYFKEYLIARGHPNLANLVTWGPPNIEGRVKRSKTAINMMKLYVYNTNSHLSSIIEANEAHIRFMSGTWRAISKNILFVILGIVISLTSLVYDRFTNSVFSTTLVISFLQGTIHLFAMLWAKKQIESFFHYQRVRELTYIVACAYYAGYGEYLEKKKTDKESG